MQDGLGDSCREQAPPQISGTAAVVLVDQCGCTANLGQLLFAFDQVGRTVFVGVRFQMQESTQAFFFEKDRIESETRGQAADGFTGVIGSAPSVEQLTVAGPFCFLLCHRCSYFTRPRSWANVQSERVRYAWAYSLPPEPPASRKYPGRIM